jgi:hypothetical protein
MIRKWRGSKRECDDEQADLGLGERLVKGIIDAAMSID